jgi:ribosomal protein S24E
MSTELVVLRDYDNQLMNRRELQIIFRNVSGNIKKKEAIETISKANKLDSKTIVPIEIKCNKGSTDVSGFFHIYKSEESAKEILPKYISMRILEKAERKKIFDEAKAQKLKEKQQTSEKGKPKK